jgi:predicted nucleic acid-binding protein
MIVVDTNIVVYLLLEGARTGDAQALYARDADWRSEAFLLVEFSNVLATHQRAGALAPAVAEALLASAERIVTGMINIPHPRALKLAAEFSVSAYDARFLGTAQRLGTRLVTEDARLRAAAPALTRSLAQALAV